ncbi:FGGY-family carbohydrate kinase [Rhizobium tubonense]|uniref:Carbohydrate kinase n=1 Tax=Rhizobium tubonense TaxID=484088 RepID=A0A2W4C9Y3_9HYPH|nr:FGGY-family carbohydrate kinase [Rhizobium tubonense]PZM08168.1 carbohydrate kinase [Rhizobium tubonense]
MNTDASPIVVGIDIGTSGARSVAMSVDGTILASGTAKLEDFSSNHRDPSAWWQAVSAALGEALAQIDRDRVRALSIDGTSGTLLPVDAVGRPLATPLMYNDVVEDRAILDRIAGNAPIESAVHGSTSGLAKLLVFQSISGVAHVLHQADWLAGRLTGRYGISDENNALKTGYDPILRRWPDWIAKTGVRTDLLLTVTPAGTPNGELSADIAVKFGLTRNTLVVAGTTDGCASFLATGADQPGDGVTALGTTLTVKMLSDRPLFAPEYGLYSHRIGDMWLAGGASNSGGAVLAHHFSADRIVTLSGEIDAQTQTGLDYYPLLRAGERFPINDPVLPARMVPRPDSDVVFLKAIFEGIAAIESLGYERLGSLGGPTLRSVRTVGGGARNVAWSEIRRRRLDVPFLPIYSQEAAAGTARLALIGAKAAGVL